MLEEYVKNFVGNPHQLRSSRGGYTRIYPFPFLIRLKILLIAIRHVFTGKDMWLSKDTQIQYGQKFVVFSTMIKDEKNDEWENWLITFDGTKTTSRIDGKII